MIAPVLALALCALAAVSGAALVQPMLAAHDVPVPFAAAVIFVGLLALPLLLSGDWLWKDGERRSGPSRGKVFSTLAVVTGVVGFAGPLVLTDRPLSGVISGVQALVTSSPSSKPEAVTQASSPEPDIRPTPMDAEFPTVPVVVEAEPLKVIEGPTAPQLAAEAPPGTFFVYEWQDPQGTTHWANVFEEIPTEAKVLKATVMKPVEPQEPPKWAVAKAPSPAVPSGTSYFNDPRLPSFAETHWRSQFRQIHSRIRTQERKIETKQRELWDAPVISNRRALEQELQTLKRELDDLKQEDQDLEREASYRAVPREWRH